MKNQNCSLLNVNSVVKAMLLTVLLIAGSTADAQPTLNLQTSVTTKKYRVLPNPLLKIKPGKEVEVLVIDGKAYLEGDIYLGTVEELDRYQNALALMSVRIDTSPITGRWENGIVPFVIPDEFTEFERQVIVNAMNQIAAQTNVCFRRRTNQSGYLKFRKSEAIFGLDYSGYSTLGKCTTCFDGQDVALVSVDLRTVKHEIGHALGLMHEQNREDRDNHVRILSDNIAFPFQTQFQQAALISTDVGNYDFNSIMHYHAFAFGKIVNGTRLQTMERRSNPGNTSFGTAPFLSAGDINGINSMYPTNQNCQTLSILEPGELAVGQSRTINIYAKNVHNFTGAYLRSGQRFEFTTTNPSWKNGWTRTDADGYNGSIADVGRRHNDLRMMALVGELSAQSNSNNFPVTYFRIGRTRTLTMSKTGYLDAFANDCLICYGDNSEKVVLKVKRIS